MVCFIHMEEVVEEGSGGGKNENNSSDPIFVCAVMKDIVRSHVVRVCVF